MSEAYDRIMYARRMLESMLRVSGYIDDVARRMIALAALLGEGKTIECTYNGIVLHASGESSVAHVRAYFERQCNERRWSDHRAWLRSVAC